jgi:hypothetical protein
VTNEHKRILPMKSEKKTTVGITSDQIAKRPTEAFLGWQKSLASHENSLAKKTFRQKISNKCKKKNRKGEYGNRLNSANGQAVFDGKDLSALLGPDQLTRSNQILSMQAFVLSGFTKLFSGPGQQSKQQVQQNSALLKSAIALLVNSGLLEGEESGQATAPRHLSMTSPAFTEDETYSLQATIVNAAKVFRPGYVAQSADAETAFAKFFEEFVKGGAMEAYKNAFLDKIEQVGKSESEKLVAQKFIQGISWCLTEVAKGRSPLDIYVKPDDINRVARLRKWLKGHYPSHSKYLIIHDEYQQIINRIDALRNKAFEEGFQWLSLVVGQMLTKTNMQDSSTDLIEHQRRQAEKKAREILTLRLQQIADHKDHLEPSKLRSFYESLYRLQQGKLFYQFVCESQQPKFFSSNAHQIAKNLWLFSQIDTVHVQPGEVRSRMPTSSNEGLDAPNFGYQMNHSKAYQHWLQENPLAQACGDVIMDSFSAVVDYGKKIDVETFVARIVENVFYWSKEQQLESILRKDQYDVLTTTFEFFLLESVFDTSFISDGDRNVISELRKAAKTEKELATKTRKVLIDFKSLCVEIDKLKPNKVVNDGHPFVFGIGFNGSLFGCPSHQLRNKNEIWLTFSAYVRYEFSLGSDAFLSLLIHFATNVYNGDINNLSIGQSNVAKNLQKYKGLIRLHIDQRLAHYRKVSSTPWSAGNYEFQVSEIHKYYHFIEQLDQQKVFNELSEHFQAWLRDSSNWYRLPSNATGLAHHQLVHIKIAKPLTVEEQGAQQLTRCLLLDLICKRNISTYYPEFVSWLFLHWQQQLADDFSEITNDLTGERVSKAKCFDNLSQEDQKTVKEKINEIAWDVHPEIYNAWQPRLDEAFGSFTKSWPPSQMRKRQKDHLEARYRLQKKYENKQKASLRHPENTQLVSDVKELKDKLDLTPKSLPFSQKPVAINQMSEDNYSDFKEHIFGKAEHVSQCIEPAFARVLGHDCFFAVYIGKNIGNTQQPVKNPTPLVLGNHFKKTAILPCGKFCQIHATGHLYTGDLLADQSADRLNAIRITHGQSTAPFRLMPQAGFFGGSSESQLSSKSTDYPFNKSNVLLG